MHTKNIATFQRRHAVRRNRENRMQEEKMRRLRTLYDEADAPCRYQRVAAALEEAVREGLFKPGDALPTQRALAAELKVTTGTATHGYAEAARRGLVAGVTGRGTFVSSTGSDVDVMPPPAPLPPSTQWPDAEAAAPSDGDSSAEPALESRLHCAVRVAESFAAQGARQPSAPPERQRTCGASELPSPGGHGSTPARQARSGRGATACQPRAAIFWCAQALSTRS